MAQDQPKDWRKLCEAAASEQDPDKLLALVVQIIIALDERNQKRKGNVRDNTGMEYLAGELCDRTIPDRRLFCTRGLMN